MTVVGRLFSTVQIEPKPYGSAASETDLLLQVETGPGVPGFGYLGLLLGTLLFGQFILLTVDSVQSSNNERELLIESWALTFVRLYIGLMFVPHFVGHIFAGPNQFGIYTQYFAGLGLPLPAVQLLLAGTVELIAAIGLCIGTVHTPRCLACIGVFADVDVVGRAFHHRLCLDSAERRLRIRRVLGRHDCSVRIVGRRPEFGRPGTTAQRAGPPSLTKRRIECARELGICSGGFGTAK